MLNNKQMMVVWITLVLHLWDIVLRLNASRPTASSPLGNAPEPVANNSSACASNYPDPINATASAAANNFNLRFDWSNLPVQSPLARHIQTTQHQCGKNQVFFNYTHKRNGFGQNLHVWSAALCDAMEAGAILLSRGAWVWNLPNCNRLTRAYPQSESPFWCFWGRHESIHDCPQLAPQRPSHYRKNLTGWSFGRKNCPKLMRRFNASVSDFRAASMEYLFQSVTPRVLQEALRQVRQAFPNGLPDPQNLVTVHIRWGDKKVEMDLQPIENYVRAVQRIVSYKNYHHTAENPLYVYLTSESPEANAAFVRAAHEQQQIQQNQHWIIGSSGPKTPQADTNIKMFASGEAALGSLGSLLVALQANHYVLTTRSNWSRLINEMRKNVVDARCNKCTHMVDLHYGEW